MARGHRRAGRAGLRKSKLLVPRKRAVPLQLTVLCPRCGPGTVRVVGVQPSERGPGTDELGPPHPGAARRDVNWV